MIARHDFMSHTQKPTVYGIGGLTILVHMSDKERSSPRSGAGRAMAEWAIADGKVARCVPNTHDEL
jgi:hypothetical protein